MSKKWKIKVADWFLRRYTAKYGRFQDKATFDGAQQFDNIVIYSTTALGDFMFNTPALRAMRERYPNAHITLVVHKKTASWWKTAAITIAWCIGTARSRRYARC